MNKKILASLLMIGIVAAVLGGATYAVFSDTEKSVDNTMTAGTIDFSVDGENPWATTTWSAGLNDLKPCVVRYGEFEITNVGTNPMKLWKRFIIDSQNGGTLTEPECVEGGGVYENDVCSVDYTERCNIASYTLYDMNVTIDGGDPVVIIDHANQVRLDNVNGVWIYLGELSNGSSMIVNQSYHLSSWDGAAESSVTNWAQGDMLTFDVELYGEQITGPGVNTGVGTLVLRAKDTTTWAPITGTTDPYGVLTFERSASQFTYDFDATYLTPSTSYTLIYYPDGVSPNVGATIGVAVSDTSGAISIPTTLTELDMDLPISVDTNSPAGAKIWLVPTGAIDGNDNLEWSQMGNFLYEMNLIQYDDTDV